MTFQIDNVGKKCSWLRGGKEKNNPGEGVFCLAAVEKVVPSKVTPAVL